MLLSFCPGVARRMVRPYLGPSCVFSCGATKRMWHTDTEQRCERDITQVDLSDSGWRDMLTLICGAWCSVVTVLGWAPTDTDRH